MLHADSIPVDANGRGSAREKAPKRLVMTGGTSGIGRRVIERLLAEYPEWALILLARLSARSRELWEMRGCERLTVIGHGPGQPQVSRSRL